ncbi:Os04g0221450 [Oryza sativa Japonica Group]|uniref:Os04g0221450 protein n=1 Tax=Oryza sativa subsp. japonica TaxID=39947 RepID=A0A0N7KIP3_ORYSJ|nr:Os04g0221450 [Oryza sativa Japonica Group]
MVVTTSGSYQLPAHEVLGRLGQLVVRPNPTRQVYSSLISQSSDVVVWAHLILFTGFIGSSILKFDSRRLLINCSFIFRQFSSIYECFSCIYVSSIVHSESRYFI